MRHSRKPHHPFSLNWCGLGTDEYSRDLCMLERLCWKQYKCLGIMHLPQKFSIRWKDSWSILKLVQEFSAWEEMSYSVGIAMRPNLMEKDRSSGIRLACPPSGMWGGGRSIHSQSGKEKCPLCAQGLVRGKTGFPKGVLFSCTPHHKQPRQVTRELRVIFHLMGKAVDKPAWKNNKS